MKTNKLILSAEIIILVATGYLLVKKAFGFSVSGWLLNNALKQNAVDVIVLVSATLIVIAFFLKVVSMILGNFSLRSHSSIEPDQISDCIQVMNDEIHSHINKCRRNPSPKLTKLAEQHSFDVNNRLIVEALAEHLRNSIEPINIKRKDLFISLYTFNKDLNILQYELHYDHKRDLINTKEIPLDSSDYQDYECVKCMNSKANTIYAPHKALYTKSHTKRYKTVKQYMGCKLAINDDVFGFLNIEFHNYEVFDDEESMQDFMEENVFPFKLLIEYQYLKKEFFNSFSQIDENWRVSS